MGGGGSEVSRGEEQLEGRLSIYHSFHWLSLGLYGLNLVSHGIPTEEEFVANYCCLTNTPDISSHWNFYLAFTFFRVAAILQGVYKRSLQSKPHLHVHA